MDERDRDPIWDKVPFEPKRTTEIDYRTLWHRATAQLAQMREELEALRCPLAADAHQYEKMRQHYCPAQQDNAQMRVALGLADRLIGLCVTVGGCVDCRAAMRHACSDATTPGFFYDKCEKHRLLAEYREASSKAKDKL